MNVNKYRLELLDGHLSMPKIPKIKQVYGDKVYKEIEQMFQSLWHNYLQRGEAGNISLPYWAQRIKNIKAMNIALILLSKNGWITSKSIPINNWGEAYLNTSKLLEYLDENELGQVRKRFKFSKYILNNEPEAKQSKLTKINGSIKDTGLVRKGFTLSGNTKFQFDTDTMYQYKDEVIQQINKGILKMKIEYPEIGNDFSNYEEVGKEIVEHYLWNQGVYSAGQGYNDSRGRNISGMLNKIGNPIGFKIMRSLLIMPEEFRNVATAAGLRNKYLFIAEILGYKKGNVAGKVNYGRRAYLDKKLLLLELPKDIDSLYENIFLERMYNEIDIVLNISDWKKKTALALYNTGSLSMTACAKKIETFNGSKWWIPAEIDVGSSIIVIEGLLLGHQPYMQRTNMIGSTIGDPWGHNIITNRIQMKSVMRKMYGSSMPVDQMWQDMGIKYTQEEVTAFNKELETGDLALANKFKDFMIQNSHMKKEMTVVIDNQKFNIECNKHFNVGETTNQFDFYDTSSNSIRRIHNTETVKKPDLARFSVFVPTCLVHSLDGSIMDNTMQHLMKTYGWGIDIHDAIIADVEAINYTKKIYCAGSNKEEPSLERLYRERNNILGKYFTSIGIKKSAITAWNQTVKPLIKPYKGTFKCNTIVLK